MAGVCPASTATNLYPTKPSNIVLDVLDKELEQRGHRFARYADDLVILVKSRRAVEPVAERAGTCLGTGSMGRASLLAMNRPVRTRMQGGVGAGRVNLLATRLGPFCPSLSLGT